MHFTVNLRLFVLEPLCYVATWVFWVHCTR